MALIDLPVVVQHGFDWAVCRCHGLKWIQFDAIPQGIPYGVGIATLRLQRDEHKSYEEIPEQRERVVRARLLDDGLA